MKHYLTAMLAGSSILALTPVAHAQSTETSVATSTDIVVTARRRDERLQDVPLTVNAVTGDTLTDLGIRRLEDIESIVPGLSITPGTTAPSASLRGVEFNTFSSGNNSTVEFYVNDAPATAPIAISSLFDVGQIEVLRGPQGTLRGRASPSGAITVTSQRPNFYEYGANLETTLNNLGGANLNGAVNIPIIEEKLAIRIAGFFNEDEGAGIESINSTQDPFSRTTAARYSVLFEPTSWLTLSASHQRLVQHVRQFMQVETRNLADPSQPAFAHAGSETQLITAGDRLGVQVNPDEIRQEYNITNWQAEYRFAGQKLNYVGAHTTLDLNYNGSPNTGDYGGFFADYTDADARNLTQFTRPTQTQESHEIRLSSDDRLFGALDYVVGAYTAWLSPDSAVDRPTLIFGGFGDVDPGPGVTIGLIPGTSNPGDPALRIATNIGRISESEETSVFGNVNWHIDDATELSVGTRYISYQSLGYLVINGALNPAATQDDRFHAQIYSASLKHNFTDDLMVYASTGTSWRPGVSAVGDFSVEQSALERSHLVLEPETSTSYEVGFKSEWLDNRLRVNVSAYHQEFENYPYRGGVVYFVNTGDIDPGPGVTLGETVTGFNFVSAVPVEINGVELETAFRPLENWNIAAVVSYSHGEIAGGNIACNDLNGDGVADVLAAPPSVTDIENATGGDVGSGGTNINECSVTQASSFAPEWSASLQSEYSMPFPAANFEAFVRGQLAWNGETENDPTNPYDDVESYSLLNLYAGIRDPEGAWELMFYVKNATDTEEVLTRGAAPLSVEYRDSGGAQNSSSNYREITMTRPQEAGVTLRYALGAR